MFGGRIAEEVDLWLLNLFSTGASNDIERATNLARKMVTQWGFSEKLGPLLYAEEEGEVFLGRSVTKNKSMSEDTVKLIDAEIRDFIDRNYSRAKQLIEENMDILHAMKDCLMQYETIDAKQIDDLMARREVRPPEHWEPKDKKPDQSTGGDSTATTELKVDDKPAETPIH